MAIKIYKNRGLSIPKKKATFTADAQKKSQVGQDSQILDESFC